MGDRFFKLITMLCVMTSYQVIAQDERFLRQLFSGGMQREKQKEVPPAVHYRVQSPFYEFDFDGDFRNEKMLVEKKDAQTWLHIHNYEKKRIFSYKFDVNGVRSDLYRIQVRNLSHMTRVLILYFYEGKTDFVNLEGSARVYFLTIDNSDLKTLAVKKGPAIWEEAQVGREHYHQRSYKISMFDYNRDGIDEVTVKYHLSSKVYFYKGKGKWLRN